MTTNGSVPLGSALHGTAARCCPSCGREAPPAFGSVAGAEQCGCSGPGLEQAGATRRTKTSVASKATDALDRWLAGEAIEPKHVGDWELAGRWVRRHRRVSSLAAMALIGSIIVAVSSFVAYLRTAEAVQQMVLDRNAIEQNRLELSEAVSRKVAEIGLHEDRWRRQQFEQQQLENQLHELKVNYEQSQQQCRAADQRLHNALREQRMALAEQLSLQAEEVRSSLPDTSLLLAAKALTITQQEGVPPIPGALQQVRDLLAPADGRTLPGQEGPVAQLAASRDGKWLASGDHHGTVRLWATSLTSTIENPKLLHGHWGRITQLLFSADSRWLVSGSADSTVYLWDLEASDPIAEPFFLQAKRGRIVAFAMSDDGRWLAAASTGLVSDDNSVRLWDLHARDVIANSVDLPTYQGRVRALAVSPDGQWIASGDDDGTVRLWRFSDASHAVASTTLRMHDAPIRVVRFSPDGNWLVTAASGGSGQSNTIHAWNLADTNTSADVVLADDSSRVDMLGITADGRWLVAASEEPALRVWDLTALDKRQSGRILDGQTNPVQAIALSTNGKWLATTGTDSTVRLWSIGPTGPADQPVTIHDARGQITGTAFTANGNWLTTGDDQGTVRLWNLEVDDLIRMANSRLLP
jgi:WD40 repeat protein